MWFFFTKKKILSPRFLQNTKIGKKKCLKRHFFYLKPLAGSRRRLYLLVHFLLDLKEVLILLDPVYLVRGWWSCRTEDFTFMGCNHNGKQLLFISASTAFFPECNKEASQRGIKYYFRNQNGHRFKMGVKVFSNNIKIRKANGQIPVGDSGMFCHYKGEWR